MMIRYRCSNARCSDDPHGRLIFDFEAELPICPKCGTDGRQPKYRDIITRLKTTHFDPPSHVAGRGLGHVACNPSFTIEALPPLTDDATGEPLIVTCQPCRATEAFRLASAERRPSPATSQSTGPTDGAVVTVTRATATGAGTTAPLVATGERKG